MRDYISDLTSVTDFTLIVLLNQFLSFGEYSFLKNNGEFIHLLLKNRRNAKSIHLFTSRVLHSTKI